MKNQLVLFYQKSTNKMLAVVEIDRACNAWKWITASGIDNDNIYTETAILNDYEEFINNALINNSVRM